VYLSVLCGEHYLEAATAHGDPLPKQARQLVA
jgi:hypothetical protein